MSLRNQSKGTLYENESLDRHSTFHIGGYARYFVYPRDTDEIDAALNFAKENTLPFCVIGGGSNILFRDEGFNGLIISMRKYHDDLFDIQETCLRCSAGMRLATLVHRAQEHSLGGFEFLAGIPGTLGGAVMQNTSFHGRAMADMIETVLIYDPESQTYKTLTKKDLHFKYRALTNVVGIVLEVSCRYTHREREEIEQDISTNISYRKAHHDLRYPSVGCIFKNPTNDAMTAGALIDQCGLKGLRVGGAQISELHANYIINVRNATSHDVEELISVVQRTVREKCNIDLELEVKCV